MAKTRGEINQFGFCRRRREENMNLASAVLRKIRCYRFHHFHFDDLRDERRRARISGFSAVLKMLDEMGVSNQWQRRKKCAAPISTYWCFDWLIWPQLRQKVICQSAKGIADLNRATPQRTSTYTRTQACSNAICSRAAMAHRLSLYISDGGIIQHSAARA